ncbi:MAG: TIGR01841 family phasin [Alphaproteobacteria bacterium]|nr:TIGR01841 family phasin [Alphaproteobacteria bacterium]
MAKNDNVFTQFFSNNDFSKLYEQFQVAPFDLKAVMEAQRKNVQAFADAQQVAMESLQALAQRQTEIISQLVEDHSQVAKELMGEGSPESKIAKNADLFKRIYERTVSNLRELSDMVNKSNVEASNIINKRVSAGMSELKSALEKSHSHKKAA